MMLKSDFNKFKLYPSYGGDGGKPFDDRSDLNSADPIESVQISTGDRLDAIAVRYQSGKTVVHGKPHAKIRSLHLIPGEFIRAVCYSVGTHKGGERIFDIELRTNFGQFIQGRSS